MVNAAGGIKPVNLLATATAAKSSGTVTATIDGTTVTVQIARDLTVAAGDVMLVHRVGSLFVASQRLFPAAVTVPENPAGPDPKPPSVSGSLSVSPVETRSYRSGSWRTDNNDVYQGAYGGNGNHTGCAFYGGKPRSLAGATVLSASVRVRRKSAGGITAAQSTTLRLVTQATRPGGAPSLGASTSGPRLKWGATDDSFDIPTSWAQSMVDGTAGGLGIFDASGSPYVILAGKGSWSPAFTMTIRWKR